MKYGMTYTIEDNNKDLVILVNAILDTITNKDMITGKMLNDWGQELYHITHRVKS